MSKFTDKLLLPLQHAWPFVSFEAVARTVDSAVDNAECMMLVTIAEALTVAGESAAAALLTRMAKERIEQTRSRIEVERAQSGPRNETNEGLKT